MSHDLDVARYSQMIYKTSWNLLFASRWDRFWLRFVPAEVVIEDGIAFTFKRLGNRIYAVKEERLPDLKP